MNYSNKGYSILNESKKAKDVQLLFLSARAEKTTKSSNSIDVKQGLSEIENELRLIKASFFIMIFCNEMK